MEKHDDAPEDVKRATPVEGEIKKGEEDDTFEGYPRVLEKKRIWEHCKDTPPKKSKRQKKSDGDCCETRRKKKKEKELVPISVFKEPCTFPKVDIVPRHCLTKSMYIDMLATSSRKCPPDCHKRIVLRKLKPLTPRMKELAQPPRHKMLINLQQGAAILPTALLDNLIRNLEHETCLTPEQAASLRRKKKTRVKKKQDKKEQSWFKESRKSKKSSGGAVNTGAFDKDAILSQYLIAEHFVKSILQWKCPIPKSEFSDVSEVIVKRLVDTLEYTTPQQEDRKSQQLRFLADVVACWICGVMSEVAERHKEKLEERCKKKEEEMEAAEEEEEDDDEYEDEEEDKDEDREKDLDWFQDEYDDDKDEGDKVAETPDVDTKNLGTVKTEAVDDAETPSVKETKDESEAVKDKKMDKEDVTVATEKPVEAETETKPIEVAEVVTETNPNVDAAAQAEAEGEAKARADAETNVEEEAKAKAEEETKAQVEAEAEAKAKAQAEKEAEAKAQAEKEAEAKAQAEKETEAKTQAEKEAEAKAQAEKEAEAKAQAEKEAEEKAQAEKEAEAKAQAEKEAEAKAQAEKEAEAKAQAEKEAEAKVQAEKEAEAKAQAEKEAEAKVQAEKEAEAKAQAEKEAEAKAQAEKEAEAKAQAEKEAEEKTQAEKEAKAQAEAEAKAQAEKEAKAQAEAEAKVQAEKEAEEKAKAQAVEEEKAQKKPEVVAQPDAEVKVEEKAEVEAKVDEETKGKVEKEAKAQAEKEAEAKAQAKKEAKARTEKEAKAKAKAKVEDAVEKPTVEAGAVAPVAKDAEKVKKEAPQDKLPAEGLEDLFKTDLPFITFGKIIDTLYQMIASTPENTGEDPITNGIHRVIYEKLTYIVMLEDPQLLTEELKDIMDVLCGKIANWLRSVLTKSQIAFMQQYIPVVESKEIRDWTKWLKSISDAAINWNIWIRKVIEEIVQMEGAKITRGEWHDWTKSIDTGALLWRRFHLQTVHQAHRNVTMLIGRRVIKTGTRGKTPNTSEQLINTMELNT